MHLSEYILYALEYVPAKPSTAVPSTPTSKQGNKKDTLSFHQRCMPHGSQGIKTQAIHNKHSSAPKKVLLQQHHHLQAPAGPSTKADQNLVPQSVTQAQLCEATRAKAQERLCRKSNCIFSEKSYWHTTQEYIAVTEKIYACLLYRQTKTVQIFVTSSTCALLCTSSSAMQRKLSNYP